MRSVCSVAFFMHYWINPITDPRWVEFISGHPSSSVFHTREWLSALQRTYGYTSLVLTTSPPGAEITNGIPFCRVNSIFTGNRLVSLPFSDHCQPLSPTEELLQILPEIRASGKFKYVELRPLEPLPPYGLASSGRYLYHSLDLRPPLDEIIRKFHPDCVRRKIRRAGREDLKTESGRSEKLLKDFYSLQVITRKRHGLPPQPIQWFRNLLDSMGDKAKISVACFEGRPVAAILTLRHIRTAVYKYGCSDASENNRGGMQLLLWNAIEEAKSDGMEWMDLGRCDIADTGLAEFKERWGAARKEIAYYRCPTRPAHPARTSALISKLPQPVLILAGRLLYRHMG
jgi:hypothetical protein